MSKLERPSVLDPRAADLESRRPYRTALKVGFTGYVVLSVVLLAVGFVLTHLLNSTVGRWDEHVNQYFAHHRTGVLNAVTSVATSAFNTLSVVAAASVVVAFLALRRLWQQAALLVVGLVLDVTVFLSVTFVVARPRPSVVRLNSTPSTSSFPSGHTAAATVLFVGLAIIVASCTASRLARGASAVIAGLVTTTVGFARVYRGLHHPTDVLFGVVLGVSCLVVATIAIRAASAPQREPVALPGRRLPGGGELAGAGPLRTTA
jgi:undecaprenyl-diphosphatase